MDAGLWPLILIVLGASAIGCLCMLPEWSRDPEYARSHPPISDEEFVKLCPPGTPPELAIRVREIIAETLSVNKEEIYPGTRFIEDLKAG